MSVNIKIMNRAYFRHMEGTDDCYITLRLNNPDLSLDKQFNFCRKMSESASAFVSRLSSSLEKAQRRKANRKKKNAVDQVEIDQTLKILRNGQQVEDDFVLGSIFDKNSSFAIQISNQALPIKINSPWIEQLALSKSAMAGFPFYPSKCEGYYFDVSHSTFTWFRFKKDSKIKEERIGEGYYYMVTPSDIGFHFKMVCEPGNECEKGPSVEAITQNPIEAGPGLCPFENRHAFTPCVLADKDTFRVITYNILADMYADTDDARNELFPYCPPYALEISYRKQLLMKEILGYNGDIICLQEVDRTVFLRDFEPMLKLNGLEGYFCPKGSIAEGCAIFFRNLKFDFLWHRRIVFSQDLPTNPLFTPIWDCVRENEALATRLLGLYTSLQLVALRSRTCPNEILLVANTHLYFHPDADHVRLLHGGLGAIYVNAIAQELENNNVDCRISVIWCGDFNSVPECGIYQLLTTGFVGSDFTDWSSSTSDKEEAVKGVSFSSKRIFKSACGTPQFTNFTHSFQACLDYIYIDNDNLTVEQVVPLLHYEELTAHVAIPSVVVPSDHIALIADLKII